MLKHINKTELTMLGHNFEACISQIDRLEKGRMFHTSIVAVTVGSSTWRLWLGRVNTRSLAALPGK